MRRYLLMAVPILVVAQLAASASAQIPSFGAVSSNNVHSEGNAVNLGGNAMDYFERRLADGSTKRYIVAANYTTGFDIVDITDPLAPTTVGRYASPGSNYHTWVQVNGPRNIAAVSIGDEGGASVAHGGSNGVEFVDITDVANPTRLGVVSGLQGPHTIRMIGENHIYTTVPTFIIDYTNPQQPVNLGQKAAGDLNPLCGHEFAPDPNIPGRTYAGLCGNSGEWAILDTTDAANPQVIHHARSGTGPTRIEYAHEVFAAPDSSFVGIGDFRIATAGGGQGYSRCPGGGVHFFDISGKYIPGASPTNPQKMGEWFAPFTGIANEPINPTSNPNWASCNLHSLHFHPERPMLVVGLYAGGSWVVDPTAQTATGGDYQEYPENPGPGLGPTTWGNTKGNYIAEGDYVNAAQWLPFDIPVAKDHYYTNGMARGLDVLHFEGEMPKKLSRIRIDASAPSGVVSGVLDRYAVLTHEGWENKPLAGKAVEIRSGGTTLTATTGADGSFSADIGVSGSSDVTVTWAGDEDFATASLTQQVSA